MFLGLITILLDIVLVVFESNLFAGDISTACTVGVILFSLFITSWILSRQPQTTLKLPFKVLELIITTTIDCELNS